MKYNRKYICTRGHSVGSDLTFSKLPSQFLNKLEFERCRESSHKGCLVHKLCMNNDLRNQDFNHDKGLSFLTDTVSILRIHESTYTSLTLLVN